MNKIAIALAALTIYAAPALADSIHTDGPKQSFSVNSNTNAKQDFAAKITATPVRSSASTKKTNFGSGHVFQPHELRR